MNFLLDFKFILGGEGTMVERFNGHGCMTKISHSASRLGLSSVQFIGFTYFLTRSFVKTQYL